MSSIHRALMLSAGLVLSAAAVVPSTYAAADRSQSQQGGMRGFLTPQQRAMLMMENRDQWQTMTQDQRHAARDKMRADWMAMSESDREKKRADLQAKWDALPQAQKDALNARIQQWASHRDHGDQGQ